MTHHQSLPRSAQGTAYATVTTSRPRTRWPWGWRQSEGGSGLCTGHRASSFRAQAGGMETGALVRSSPLTSGSRTSPSSSRTRGTCRSGGDTALICHSADLKITSGSRTSPSSSRTRGTCGRSALCRHLTRLQISAVANQNSAVADQRCGKIK